jgi:ABC-type antimicrobial peptide transport system permease subunit
MISFINIAGLTLGMTSAILLVLNIQYEFSVDQFHPGKENIYRAYDKAVRNGRLESWNVTPAPLGPALAKDYAEVRSVTRIVSTEKLLGYSDKKLMSKGNYADPSFLTVFSFPLVKGDIHSVLGDVHSIVITETLARKIFGNEDPINKSIQVDNSGDFTVKGVLKDLPDNTDLKFEYLLPWASLKNNNNDEFAWNNPFVTTFVSLQQGTNLDAFNNKIAWIINSHAANDTKIQVFLYPFAREHMWGKFENGKAIGGRIENVRMLGILALVLLLIACINFMNLSTARSEKRSREIAMRKVMGAVREALIGQFIGESILYACLAGIISLALARLMLPLFAAFDNVNLKIAWESPWFWLGLLGFMLFTGIIAGSYPAFYLSSFQAAKTLKGPFKSGKGQVTPRKVLVIIQFVFAVFLINFTLIFRKQLNYSEGRDTGFVKENLIFHPLTDDLRKNYASMKNELIFSGAVKSVCESSAPITRGGTEISGLNWEGMDPKSNLSFELLSTTGDFVTTNGLSLLEGRDINLAAYPTDSSSCLINAAAAKVLGFKRPVGQIIKDDSTNMQIVGVVRDFIIGAPTQAINPMIITGKDQSRYIDIRINGGSAALDNLKKTEAIIKKYNPNQLTEIQFIDDDYAAKFRSLKNAGTLINTFTLIAIFISCMGLFGLAAYVAESRTREIGVRKVLGASVMGITRLLAKDFMRLVLIAIAIASPLAWLFMNLFLHQFSYRTNISWWILIASGAMAMFIALFTVSFQSIKGAVANPVKSLRAEG